MENKPPGDAGRSKSRSWSILFFMVLGFLVWGMFLFRFVGDKGMPGWDYGTIADVPGLSPFSTEGAEAPPAAVQHVMGQRTEDR